MKITVISGDDKIKKRPEGIFSGQEFRIKRQSNIPEILEGVQRHLSDILLVNSFAFGNVDCRPLARAP